LHTEEDVSWSDLIDVARWAPSPHNIQTWKVRPRSDVAADLLYDPKRTLPATDPAGAFTKAGLGIFVEMLAIAAAARGRTLEVEWDPFELDSRAPAPARVASLQLTDGGADELDAELIRRRRTSRLPYDGRPVSADVVRELEQVCESFGHRLTTSSDRDLVEWVLELNRDTLFYDLGDERARAEIGSWLRFSERAAAARRDGFSPRCLGFPGWLLFVFFRLPALAELPGINGAIRRSYFATMAGTQTVAWIQGPFGGHADSLEAGRLLARLWLTLTKHGVQLHPFGSIITNRRANARLRERIQIADGETAPWLIVRLGYSAEPPRSHRLRTDELLVA
jgi:hypothetical protein